jgi:hypothetical protein
MRLGQTCRLPARLPVPIRRSPGRALRSQVASAIAIGVDGMGSIRCPKVASMHVDLVLGGTRICLTDLNGGRTALTEIFASSR